MKHAILDTSLPEINDPKYNRYKSIEERIKTFKNWPLTIMPSKELATDGFIYTGKKDLVLCVYCGVNISRWEKGDKPNAEHRKNSPFCSFAVMINEMESSSGAYISIFGT